MKKSGLYIIVAEIDKTGYILDFEDNKKDAKLKFERLWELIGEKGEPENEMCRYKLKGYFQYMHSPSVLFSRTNGIQSVYALRIKSIDLFLSERENYTSVYCYDKYDKELDRLEDLFPYLNHNFIAN